MHASPHLPRLRHLGGQSAGSQWPPIAAALVLFVAVFALRQADATAANARKIERLGQSMLQVGDEQQRLFSAVQARLKT